MSAHVGFITSTRTWGGAEHQTQTLAEHLCRRGAMVTIVQAGHDYYRRNAGRSESLRLLDTPAPTELGLRRWHALLSANRFSVVVLVKGHFTKHWPSLDLAIQLGGQPALAIEHSYPPDPPSSPQRYFGGRVPGPGFWYRGQWLKIALHRGALRQVIAVSEAVRRRLVDDYGYSAEQVAVVVNGVDPARFRFDSSHRATARARWGISPDAFVFGYVGRLGREKRIDRLLMAMQQVVRDGAGPPAKLVLVGEGPRRGELKAQAATLGLADRCVFTGSTHAPWEAYPGFDCAVFAGDQEGLSLASLEASAAERPVVVTAAAGLAETVIDGVTGCIAPPTDDGLARAMLGMVSSSPRQRAQLGAAGRAHVLAHHDGLQQLDRAADLIEKVANPSTRL